MSPADPPACNIDARGRLVRGVFGLIVLAIGAGTGYAAWTGRGLPWTAVVAGVLVLLGLFGLYEARKGWCAVRAMGWKTPI